MNYTEARYREIERAMPAIMQRIGGSDSFNAGGMNFLLGQLTSVETRVFERRYAPLLYRRLVAVSTEGGPGVTGFFFRTMDGVGQGKRISNCADDIPYSDFAMGGQWTPVVVGAVGYHYQTEELRQAAQLGVALSATKARYAFRAYENHMNKVALVGEDRDLFGLCNNPNVVIIQAAAPIGPTSTYQEIMALINSALGAVYMGSAMNTFADTILIPPSLFEQWISIFNPYTGVPLTEMISEFNYTTISGGGPLEMIQVPQLETAAVDGGRRIVVYNRGEDNAVMHIPMPLTFLPPQPEDLDIKFPGEYRYSGVEIRYYSSYRYIDDV